MRLTTKGRYAVTAMLDLAIHATDSPVPLAEISQLPIEMGILQLPSSGKSDS